MKVFYLRVSTTEQNIDRQIKMAKDNGIEDRFIFIDKQSGKDTERPQLKKMLQFIQSGDTVYTESISRIARNTKDLLNIIDELNKKQVDFVSLKENIDTTTPQGQFMLTVFGAIATLERDCILQRQAEGIAEAKKRGVYKGRKPKDIDKEKFTAAVNEWKQSRRTARSIQREFDITAPTFYKKVKEYEAALET